MASAAFCHRGISAEPSFTRPRLEARPITGTDQRPRGHEDGGAVGRGIHRNRANRLIPAHMTAPERKGPGMAAGM